MVQTVLAGRQTPEMARGQRLGGAPRAVSNPISDRHAYGVSGFPASRHFLQGVAPKDLSKAEGPHYLARCRRSHLLCMDQGYSLLQFACTIRMRCPLMTLLMLT